MSDTQTNFRITWTADSEGNWCSECGSQTFATREAAQAAIDADPTTKPDEFGGRCYPVIVESTEEV